MFSVSVPGVLEEREPSLLDAACEDFVNDIAALTPTDATAWGIEGHDGELQDFSPEYWSALAERTREMLMDVDAFDDSTDESDDEEDFDSVDQVTAALLRDRLCLRLDNHYHDEDLRLINNNDSPVQTIRDTFLLMSSATPEAREAISSRLAAVPAALAGYRQSLAEAAAQGKTAPRRQIDALVGQCEDLADSGSALERIGVDPASPEVTAAKAAFGECADWLSEELAPTGTDIDAVGRDRYELLCHQFVGDTVNLDEAYEWALDRLHSLKDQQQAAAHELYGDDTSVRKAYHLLTRDERYLIHGTDAFLDWMREASRQAIAALDVPDELDNLECRIDPAGTGGIFYTPPTDDFSRPGRMWWSVPEDRTTFHTWRELATVFHEGVPGRHLQTTTTLLSDDLNLWRRAVCTVPGYEEGWAFFAEELMGRFGFLDDPGYRMGMLDAQRLGAARVALDIGVHLGKTNPEGTGIWDAAYAKSFLRDNTAMDESSLNFELTRYLGRPGRAAAGALGLRAWSALASDARAAGCASSEFLTRALTLGPMPMSMLRRELLDS